MKSKILIVGPIIEDNKSSGGEGKKLYDSLKLSGYQVIKVSGIRNKILRFLHTFLILIVCLRKYDKVVLMVFSGGGFTLSFLTLFICRIFGKPVIAVIHGGAFPEFYERHAGICSYFFSKCHLIATPSRYIQSYFSAKQFEVIYIPNYIDLSKFKIARRNLGHNILWVRAFDYTYNPELIIEAMPSILGRYPSAELTMIGPDKGVLRKCTDLVSELNITDKVRITGYIPNVDLVSFYQSHDVFVNTTRFESFGVCLIEAAACGIPIVSVSVGEIPFIWQHNISIKLTERDPESFADAICELFASQDLANFLSINAKATSENYSWENISKLWFEIL